MKAKIIMELDDDWLEKTESNHTSKTDGLTRILSECGSVESIEFE